MQPGIYDNIPSDQYHSGPGESKSLLDLARISPAHYRENRLAALASNDNAKEDDAPGKDDDESEALFIGREFHSLLLEPDLFVREYTLAFRQSDMPEAIDSRDVLVSMVEGLNLSRLPKLATGGSKDELIARIQVAEDEMGLNETNRIPLDRLQAMKVVELKSDIERFNFVRPGLLSTSGTMAQLAATLRENGVQLTLWAEVKAEWERNNGHRRILTPKKWDQIHRMRDAVMAHPAARALLTAVPGAAERSAYWIDRETGLLCRCRPDFWRDDGIIVDVKTARGASLDAFAKSINTFRYHVQHPFYVDGVNAAIQQSGAALAPAKAFVFLAVEKDACVVDGVAKGVAVYSLDADSVEIGRQEAREDLATIAACHEQQRYPGYSSRIESISLPQWRLPKAS